MEVGSEADEVGGHLMGMVKLGRAKKVGSAFQAPVPTTLGGLRMMFKVLPLYLTNKAEKTPAVAPGPFVTDASVFRQGPESGLRVTWFGHSSMLVEIDGVTLLVDPVWDERAGPVSWAGPKRFFAPTLGLAQMPRLDAVLISHDHYDHLGKSTVQKLAKLQPAARWIVPVGVGKIVRGFGVAEGRVTELDWTQSTTVQGQEMGVEVEVTAVPARHFSGRSLWNRNHTLWEAFVLRGPKNRVYCGADTGLWDGFEAIAAEYGPFDLTMLEIGAFNELWKDIHLGPDGAAEAFERLGGGVMMPVHWGLFDLALHGWREPMERLTELAEERGIVLFSPEPGRPVEVVKGEEKVADWWRVRQ